MLEDFKGLEPVLTEIHRLENEGDAITRVALQKLFVTNHETPASLIRSAGGRTRVVADESAASRLVA